MLDAPPTDLAWSADGSTVAFVANGLWTMAGDGTDPQSINLAGAVDPRTPAWSPDGMSLAFIARPNIGARPQLFTVSTSGDIAMLSALEGSEDDLAFLPRWSPDGRSIAFEIVGPRVTDAGLCGDRRRHSDGRRPDRRHMGPALDSGRQRDCLQREDR